MLFGMAVQNQKYNELMVGCKLFSRHCHRGHTYAMFSQCGPTSVINPFSAGTVFRGQNLTTSDVRFRRLKTAPTLKERKKYNGCRNGRRPHNIGIQMKQKELTKTFMMISN